MCIVYEPCLLGKGTHLLPLLTIFIDSAAVKDCPNAQAPVGTGRRLQASSSWRDYRKRPTAGNGMVGGRTEGHLRKLCSPMQSPEGCVHARGEGGLMSHTPQAETATAPLKSGWWMVWAGGDGAPAVCPHRAQRSSTA